MMFFPRTGIACWQRKRIATATIIYEAKGIWCIILFSSGCLAIIHSVSIEHGSSHDICWICSPASMPWIQCLPFGFGWLFTLKKDMLEKKSSFASFELATFCLLTGMDERSTLIADQKMFHWITHWSFAKLSPTRNILASFSPYWSREFTEAEEDEGAGVEVDLYFLLQLLHWCESPKGERVETWNQIAGGFSLNFACCTLSSTAGNARIL